MSKNECRPLIRRHIPLEDVLQLATTDELVAIADILLDEANDRFLADDKARQNIAVCRQAGELHNAVADIALEVRALGSNGIVSWLRRGQPVSYDEVVRDVAGELKVDFKKAERTADIELRVLEVLSVRLAEQAEQAEQVEPQAGEAEQSIPDVASPAEVVEPVSASSNSRFGSLLSSVSKLDARKARTALAGGALAAAASVGAVTVLPASALAAYGAYSMAARNKARPELQGLTMIVVQVARMRSRLAAQDHESFLRTLRACL